MPSRRQPKSDRTEVEQGAGHVEDMRTFEDVAREAAHTPEDAIASVRERLARCDEDCRTDLLAVLRMPLSIAEAAVSELEEAVEYVPEYFQEKWGYRESVAQLRARLTAFSDAFGQAQAR